MTSSIITQEEVFDTLPIYHKDIQLSHILRGLLPHKNISREVAQWRRKNVPFAFPGLLRYLRGRLSGTTNLVGTLSFAIVDPRGNETDFGLISLDMITDSGAEYIVNSFLGTAFVSSLRYHGLGSSNATLAVTNTALAAELASQYATANTRTVGSAVVGTTTKKFVTIANTSFSGTVTCAEWGLFSQISTLTGTPVGGYMFDRATFASQGVLATFAAKTTFTLTVASGL